MNPARAGLTLAGILALAASCAQDDPQARFARDVAPVLQRRCAASSCHGVPPGARSAREFQFPTDAYGYLSDGAMVRAAYASARRFIDTTELPEFSTLLRKGLPPELGGTVHAGGAPLRDRDDAGYRAVRDWIATEHSGGEDGDPGSLTEGERFFAERVQPLLLSSGCMLGPCHGPRAGFPLALEPGFGGSFGVAATRHNYAEAVVHLSLGGWPEQSRLARKAVRDPAAMIPHRGGNGSAGFPASMQDPLAQAVVEWARHERSLRAPGAAEHALAGLVFVAGPVAPARVVERGDYTPGGDLYLLAPVEPGGAVRNLTAALHPGGPAEVRSPAVDDAGERVAFSMRRAPGEGFAVWEMEIATGAARRVTEPAALPDGRPSSDLWPAYGPDGRLWFVSDRAGVLAEHADGYDTDLYVREADGSFTRRTHTPSPELCPTFFRVGRETAGDVAFTAIRRLGDGYKGLVYRFPNDLHSEYHQHFGITLADDVTFHARETADGNYVAVLLDREAVWSAGALVLIDRNLGPQLPSAAAAQSSLPGYLHPVSFLGPYGRQDDSGTVRREFSDGAYRDPAPLPDGRIAVARAAGTVALRDRARAPEFSLAVLTLGRASPTDALSVLNSEPLVDLPGVSETEPVALYRAVTPRATAPAPAGSTGTLSHGGVPMLENLLRQVGASGERVLRDDVRAVRVLAWRAEARDPFVPQPDPRLYPEQRASGASPHLPARVLGEVPVEADGTFQAAMPAGTAFRLQFLDADGMAVGTQHNRWFDISGGQTLHQGISPGSFDAACVHCHGARSGRAEDAFGPVDVLASASRSLARFEDDDPDRPRPAPRLDATTTLPADFSRDVLPVLIRSCATGGCHDAGTRAAGLVLDAAPGSNYPRAYESLVALGEGSRSGFRYVDVVGSSARGSALVERLLGRELDAPAAVPAPAVPHRGAPALSDDEVRRIVRWIESGALCSTEAAP